MHINRVIVWIMLLSTLLLSGCGSDPGPVQVNNTDIIEITLENTDQVSLLMECSAHEGKVLDLAFSPGGEYLVSSGLDKHIRVWDPTSGVELQTYHMTSVDMSDIAISKTDALLASGEAIWDLETGDELLVLDRGSQMPTFVAFSPDGSTLALAPLDQETRLMAVSTGELVFTFSAEQESRSKRMEFSPDGTLLALGVIDGTVRIRDLKSGDIIKLLHYNGESDIHDIRFSPNGKYLASAGHLSTAVLWDVESGEVVKTFHARDNVISLAFSPDGSVLAVGGGDEDKAILLWDIQSGTQLASLSVPEQCMALSFSPDGRLLTAGCFDGRIYYWGIAE